MYERRKLKSVNGLMPLLSLRKTKLYKYKVISMLNKVKSDIVYYTYDNSKKSWNGMSFLVPKVIFTHGSGLEMAIIDFNGEFLLSNYAFGIADENTSNLHMILRAIQTKEFKIFTQSLSSSFVMNVQIFKHLKKDFYKYFTQLKLS